MSNRDLKSQAAYLRRRKQKILKKLKQIHESHRSSGKALAGSRELERTNAKMSQLMNMG